MARLSLFLSLLAATCTSTPAFQIHHAAPVTTARTGTSKLSATQAYQVDITAWAPRNLEPFWEWADYYGIAQENFQVNTESGDNWNGMAVQNGQAGERVLFVPSMLRMTSRNVREQEFAELEPFINDYIDATTSNGDINLQSHFYLFLKILQEYDQGDQSAYFTWMDALPRKFSTALNFDDFEMDCLPPFVKFLANKDRYNYDLFVEVLQQLETPTISDDTKYNPEVTKWALNVVFTRARAAFGEAEIIPMSDMLNHNAEPVCDVQYDDEGNVHVVLMRDVQAGEGYSKCYGQPTNPSRFLATYGFFDVSPPATYCKLFPDITVTPELKDLGYGYDRMVFYVENGAIAEEVWDVMLYRLLENMDPDAQQAFYQAHMNGDVDTKAEYHQYYMAQTCDALIQHVDEMLGEIAECAETMDEGGMGLSHENLPMIRRHNDFVTQTFQKVRSNLEEMQAGLY